MKKNVIGYDLRLKAHDVLAHGFGDMKLNYLRVARKFELKDLVVKATIATDLKFDGNYILGVSA